MNYFNELAATLKLDIRTKINSLSKGLKRQSALICALATKAKYMFFDETFICDVIIVNGELYEIADRQVNRDKQCIIKPIEPGKYEYEIRYNNGETGVLEMIGNGLSDYLG